MARVRNIEAAELPADLRAIYRDFAGSYGPFRNQVAVMAHVPAALRHLMPLLLELRAATTLPKRALELAIVTVSQLNSCHSNGLIQFSKSPQQASSEVISL